MHPMFTTIGIYFVKINDSVKIQRGIEHSILQLFAWTRFIGTKFTKTARSRRGESHSPSHNTDKFPISKNDNLATQKTKKTKQFAKK